MNNSISLAEESKTNSIYYFVNARRLVFLFKRDKKMNISKLRLNRFNGRVLTRKSKKSTRNDSQFKIITTVETFEQQISLPFLSFSFSIHTVRRC